MSRTNLVLAGVLVAVLGVYLARRDWGPTTSGPAPRMFADLNIEAADRIEITGGWQGSEIVLEKLGSAWSLSSAGGYPAQASAADKFVEAVYHLRRDNLVGATDRTQADTQTAAKSGRLVRVLKGQTPMAEFRVGKTPQGSYQEVFIRRESGGEVYRTRVVLPEELEKEHPDIDIPGMPKFGPRGFDWHNYVNNASTEWVETQIWDLSGLEERELWLTRDGVDVKLFKLGDDSWELLEAGQEAPTPADADAAGSLVSSVRHLNLSDVAGRYEDVRAEYGLEKPAITLVMTFRKKVEKKAEEKKDEEKKEAQEGEGEKEGEKAEEKPAEEWVEVKRTFEVGNKITRPRELRDGEVKTEDYYAVRIGGGSDDPKLEERSGFVFLVSTWTVSPLQKKIEDLRQKPKDDEKNDGDKPEDEAEDEPGDETGSGTEGSDKEGCAEPGDGCGCGDEGGDGCGCGEGGCDEGCGEGCGSEGPGEGGDE